MKELESSWPQSFGASKWSIIFRGIVPNLTHLIVFLSLDFIAAVKRSCLLPGQGSPASLWGVMIANARLDLAGKWWR